MRIYYTGIGANSKGIHQVGEFIHIMKLHFGNHRHTLYEWVEFSGAEIML